MPNIIDYLNWRGDLTLSKDKFNEVDNLILSHIAYVDFEKFDETITLKEAFNATEKAHTQEEINACYWYYPKVFKTYQTAAASVRFKDFKILHFQKITDLEKVSQFAAVTFKLPDETLFIAFRGTDDSLVGWEEDFRMSYNETVISQEQADLYLKKIANNYPGKLRIGGHSKGGNLAIYAAMNQSNSIKERILTVHNHDGPGFSEEILRKPEYLSILPKITTYLPESSIIGLLLDQQGQQIIIKNETALIMQHSPHTWEVMGKRFVTVDELSEDSKVLKDALDNWLAGIDTDKRREFVHTLFKIFGGNAKTLKELADGGISSLTSIADSYSNLDQESKDMLKEIMKTFFGQIVQSKKEQVTIPIRKMMGKITGKEDLEESNPNDTMTNTLGNE